VTGPPLTELPRVPVADVYKRGRLAARLTRGAEGVEFTYVDDYLDSPGPAVATTLPVSSTPIVVPAGAAPPFFAGLLPEGRRLTALRRTVKTSADDDLSLLLAVGADVIGDVQVFPEGVPPYEAAPMVAVSDFADVTFKEVFARAVGADPDRVGIPGVQDKVSARMITVPVQQAGVSHLLKLNPPELPALVENEAFFVGAARQSGLRTVDATVVTDAAGDTGLLVCRFDRRRDADGRVLALAVEDGCQVLGRYPADKYAVTAEQVCRALSEQADASLVAARELLRQLAFAYLSGNGDAHAKNLAIVYDGEWRISPAFDLPSSYLYGDTTVALPLGSRGGAAVPRRAFVEFGAALGIPERAVTGALDELCDRADLWLPDLDSLPFPVGQVRKLRRTIEFRRRLLRGLGA
jgi:serine/threonine-protein kinase HipA